MTRGMICFMPGEVHFDSAAIAAKKRACSCSKSGCKFCQTICGISLSSPLVERTSSKIACASSPAILPHRDRHLHAHVGLRIVGEGRDFRAKLRIHRFEIPRGAHAPRAQAGVVMFQ